MPAERQVGMSDRDLVLAPNVYAYAQDGTSGVIKTYVGPKSDSLGANDQLVVWDGEGFRTTERTDDATKPFVKANEGEYVELLNPHSTEPERFPPLGDRTSGEKLSVGVKVVIPGPASFPLWPGQTARVIAGHRMRSNEYLVGRIYDPKAARENMERAVTEPTGEAKEEGNALGLDLDNLTMGQLFVVEGTRMSYFVPPTGIEVVPEEDSVSDEPSLSNMLRRPGSFIREAATLEQLEYCVLRDENGGKRIERGPKVVFPKPTETFIVREGTRKSRAIELNSQSGLYIKVVADYVNEDRDITVLRGGEMVQIKNGDQIKEGDELFLTGANTPLYYPRIEEAVMEYGDPGNTHRKIHATAIPSGEAVYCMNRNLGEVEMIEGPRMFLPDPRTQVLVKRILDPNTIAVMYPNNAEEVRQVNERFRQELDKDKDKDKDTLDVSPLRSTAVSSSALSSALYSSTSALTEPVSASFGGERMHRKSTYTPPRTITLDTKYQGAVAVSPFPSYAVLVMDKQGNRRVEVGPQNINLKYDETLMVVSLSTGRPKTDKHLRRDVYLRILNNTIGDRVTVETRDLVPVSIELSLRVHFEGETPEERLKWFNVENYVALLTDHCRSRIRNEAKRHGIQEFYSNTIDIIRDALLGKVLESEGKRTKRQGMSFEENGMRLYDVEVLDVRIEHPDVSNLLSNAQSKSLSGAIRVSEAEEESIRETRLEEIRRHSILIREATREVEQSAAKDQLAREFERERIKVTDTAKIAEEENAVEAIRRVDLEAGVQHEVEAKRKRDAADMERLQAEVDQYRKRMGAITPEFAESLRLFSDQRFVEQVLEHATTSAIAMGQTNAEYLSGVLEGTGFEAMLEALARRRGASNGHSKRTEEATH